MDQWIRIEKPEMDPHTKVNWELTKKKGKLVKKQEMVKLLGILKYSLIIQSIEVSLFF